MNPDEVPTVQPPDSLEIIDDEVEIERVLHRKTTTFDTPNSTPSFNGNEETNERNKNKEKHTDTDVITFKSPISPEANNTMIERTIEITTTAVIMNNRITTPVTLQLEPSKGSTNLNLLKAHQTSFQQ